MGGVETIVPSIMFLSIFGGVAVFFWARLRIQREQQQTLRNAIERGQELNDEMVIALTGDRARHPHADMRRAIILLALSLGLAGFGVATGDEDATRTLFGIAVFPFLLSAAYFAIHKLGYGSRD